MMEKNEISIVYGQDPKAMTRQLLESIDIDAMIPSKTSSIALKPNLVIAATADTGATTHTEIVIEVIEHLQKHGYGHIKIVESAWIGDSTKRAFKVNGYDKLSKTYQVPLVDVKDDDYKSCTCNGITMEISNEILATDFLISLPVLKGHCQTGMTCALKNMKGCLSDSSKRMFHTLGLHKPIATLNKLRCADLVIVDSINGDLDFEEGGNPIQTNRMFMGTDSVLIDSFGCSLMGYEATDIKYITLAEGLGIGSTNLDNAKIIELSMNSSKAQYPSGTVQQLEQYCNAASACSACYANLMQALSQLDTATTFSEKSIHIGQDYRSIVSEGIGIGTCTKGFTCHVMGCPPSVQDILTFLSDTPCAKHP